MASYNELLALIDAYINRNGVQAITGQILNGVLKAMVDQLGRGYTLMGYAEPTGDPGTPDGPESWFASVPGTYTNYGEIQVAAGELALLSFAPSEGWTKNTIYEGFREVTADIDGNVGTPEVGVSYANGVLSFDFRNMKGNPGEDGDPAGFGSVTASVDDQVGTPSVSVSSSGPDTAKNFAFAFHNLKGETGVTSVVATVDNTSGNPQCSVSLQGGQLTLAFTGLKGAQGNTGCSVDYPFTIVNNLTTDDPTQALSAAMGVELDGKVSQLEAKVDDISTGKYYGYYATSADLPDDATVDGFAYVGSGPTYTIYNCEGGAWTSTGITVNQSPVGNDEDIDQNADGKLQFANRVYNAQQPNGMGYKILRKNATFASQVTDTNTIYEIRYPFNLNSATMNLPSGCMLKFDGGKIINGTIVGNGTLIDGDFIFDNVAFSGTFINESIVVRSDNFLNDVDFEGILYSFVNARVYLERDVTQSLVGTKPFVHADIEGNGHKITVPELKSYSGGYCHIHNVVFDCSLVTEKLFSLKDMDVNIVECKFINSGNYRCCFMEECKNPIFTDNVISGTLDEAYAGSVSTNEFAVSFYACSGTIVFERNEIHDINIGSLLTTCPVATPKESLFLIKNNKITDTAGAGFKGWAGKIYDVIIDGNIVRNVNCYDGPMPDKAPLNYHGYENLIVTNNEFVDCRYGTVMDFTGLYQPEDGPANRSRGKGLKLASNTIDCGNYDTDGIVLGYCDDVSIHDNKVKSITPITLQGCKDVDIFRNTLISTSEKYSPIRFVAPSITALQDIEHCHIYENVIRNSVEFGNQRTGESSGDFYTRCKTAQVFLIITATLTSSTNDFAIRNNDAVNTLYPDKKLTYSSDNVVVNVETYRRRYVINADGENAVIWTSNMPRTVQYNDNSKCFNIYPEIRKIMLSTIGDLGVNSGKKVFIGRKRYGTANDASKILTFTFDAFLNISNGVQILQSPIVLNRLNFSAYYLSVDFSVTTPVFVDVEYVADDSRQFVAYSESDL